MARTKLQFLGQRSKCESCKRKIEKRYRLCRPCCRRFLETYGVPLPVIDADLPDWEYYQKFPERITDPHLTTNKP